jgi:hypothetical protein
MKFIGLAAAMLACVALAQAAPQPEVTEDGLVRVPSNRRVGVYRAPDVTFAHYRRIVIEPIPVAFKRDWNRRNPEVTAADQQRMQSEFSQSFRAELIEELVDRGGYGLAEDPGPDVLRIDASIVDLDYVPPDTTSAAGSKTYVRSAGSMKLVVELRDAASGVLIGRIIDYEKAREQDYLRSGDFTRDMQRADPATLAREAAIAFGNAARYTREALNVARTERE